jgi:hypothetical protein
MQQQWFHVKFQDHADGIAIAEIRPASPISLEIASVFKPVEYGTYADATV